MVVLAITEQRKKAGISQQELARMTGISQQMISRFETGSAMPNVAKLADIIKAIGCKWDDVVKL